MLYNLENIFRNSEKDLFISFNVIWSAPTHKQIIVCVFQTPNRYQKNKGTESFEIRRLIWEKRKRYMINKWACTWQNQQNDMCTQRRLRSAWASAQSDQNLHCLHEEALGPWLSLERTAKNDQTGWMPRLIWVFTGRTGHIVGFVMFWLKYEKTPALFVASKFR